MNTPENTVKSMSQYFYERLKTHYDLEELSQLCNWTLEKILGYSRIQIHLKADELINDAQYHQLIDTVEKLSRYVPIQYIFEEAEFYGLRLKLNSFVLIPRPETEELVRWILEDNQTINESLIITPSSNPSFNLLDIGTGSGCIAIAMQKFGKNIKSYAIDISEEALKIAKINAEQNEAEIQFIHADIEAKEKALESVSLLDYFDVIVSNPPYVLNSEKSFMHANVLNYEPHLALFVEDEDPLRFYKSILKFAQYKLKTEGYIYFEINELFSEELKNLLLDFGYENIIIKNDLNGKPRMVRALKL